MQLHQSAGERAGSKLLSRHFLKARSTKHGSALRWFEWNRCLRSAFRARCPSLRANWANWIPESKIALRLALLAVFRVVCKLFVVKEKLLTSRKHKRGPAIHAGQFSVNKFHTLSRLSRTT